MHQYFGYFYQTLFIFSDIIHVCLHVYIYLHQVVPGELTIVTGVPNSGKSEWIDALLCNLCESFGWKFALCSMENKVPGSSYACVYTNSLIQSFYHDFLYQDLLLRKIHISTIHIQFFYSCFYFKLIRIQRNRYGQWAHYVTSFIPYVSILQGI